MHHPTQLGINTPHNPSTDILHSPAYEDGTDSEFRNVDNWNSIAGELPKKKQITFRTRRKLKNNCNIAKRVLSKVMWIVTDEERIQHPSTCDCYTFMRFSNDAVIYKFLKSCGIL